MKSCTLFKSTAVDENGKTIVLDGSEIEFSFVDDDHEFGLIDGELHVEGEVWPVEKVMDA